MILKEMKKKCAILYKGYLKRGKEMEGKHYQEIMSDMEWRYNLLEVGGASRITPACDRQGLEVRGYMFCLQP